MGEGVIIPLVEKLHHTLKQITASYEIILVDDGSTDRSWEIISARCDSDTHLTGIRFSRNYGQHPAIKAGLAQCKGEWIVVMDCDLQDPPEEIGLLYAQTKTGADAIFALRKKSWQPFIKKMYSFLFYKLLSLFTGYRFDMCTTNFGIYHYSVVEKALHEKQKYFLFPLAMRRFSKRSLFVPVRFEPDQLRKTAYTFSKALKLAWTIIISQTFLYRRSKIKHQDYIISELKQHHDPI